MIILIYFNFQFLDYAKTSDFYVYQMGEGNKVNYKCLFCGTLISKISKKKGYTKKHLNIHLINAGYKCVVCDRVHLHKNFRHFLNSSQKIEYTCNVIDEWHQSTPINLLNEVENMEKEIVSISKNKLKFNNLNLFFL